jgi:hypothetical protein
MKLTTLADVRDLVEKHLPAGAPLMPSPRYFNPKIEDDVYCLRSA